MNDFISRWHVPLKILIVAVNLIEWSWIATIYSKV